MIPYFEYHVFFIGPLRIQVWGLFVALGIAAALWVGVREARRLKLEREAFLDLAFWSLLGAAAGARIFHIIYEPGSYAADPLAFFRFWQGGYASVGGLLGGIAAGLLYARRRGLDVLAYANLAAFVLPLGEGIGRLGCFLIHDHPGILSGSFLAVRFPDGARLDHGLLLSLAGFAIFASFLARRRFASLRPDFAAWYLVLAGLARFGLDFYRSADLFGSDARYAELTPAQYVALAFIAAGVWIFARRPRREPARA